MKYFDFNILFLFTIIFININCVLNANKINIHNKQAKDCIKLNKTSKEFYIKNALENSKKTNTTFFMFFSSKNYYSIINKT
jgi:hypothetical protein